ncbi:hypothetical protein SISSUDRAFT_1031029 [Sistotremastrum suecicum HHB10207 ss-3]|uniref:Uncharacterized protein n=1 Tax=Sistotremastrum suecicum HHB10207 ss-3 TaxID=1314776 RepID=A0A166GHM4_9AGAM|nr:hypothetical protein SISSUDRAFT_1031029 [Sistotremastrum suecicum HHB10207 ss-3]
MVGIGYAKTKDIAFRIWYEEDIFQESKVPYRHFLVPANGLEYSERRRETLSTTAGPRRVQDGGSGESLRSIRCTIDESRQSILHQLSLPLQTKPKHVPQTALNKNTQNRSSESRPPKLGTTLSSSRHPTATSEPHVGAGHSGTERKGTGIGYSGRIARRPGACLESGALELLYYVMIEAIEIRLWFRDLREV